MGNRSFTEAQNLIQFSADGGQMNMQESITGTSQHISFSHSFMQ
jgi:hypothetical protein